MTRFLLSLICFLFILDSVKSQKTDSIYLEVRLDTLSGKLHVHQKFYLTNQSPKTLRELYLHSWIGAYSGRVTPLNNIKLQNQKGALHFSDYDERGGIKELIFLDFKGEKINYHQKNREFIKLGLPTAWKNGEKIAFQSDYILEIPFDAVTGYGINPNKDYLLKYFFLQPAAINENGNWELKHYLDFEDLPTNLTNYTLKIDYPDDYRMFSDLDKQNNYWIGTNRDHFRIYLTRDKSKSFSIHDVNSNINIDFGYRLDSISEAYMVPQIQKQLEFLENHLGKLSSNQLFISKKTEKEQDFFGVEDLDAWVMKIRLFTDEEKNDLKLFQVLSYEYLDRMFVTDKINNHWIKNGIQYYLMMKYVDENYPDLKLLGHFPEEFKVLGIKPAKLFHISEMKMNDRYKLLYLYLARQNYDQPIDTPFDELSKLNQTAISGFKTGMVFYYISSYLDEGEFDTLIRNFTIQHRESYVSRMEFRNFMIENASHDLSWFFDDYIQKKEKINFKILGTEETDDGLLIKIKNRTKFPGSFKTVAYKDDVPVAEGWFELPRKKGEILFPKGDYDKIEINPGYLFPEFNDRDNTIKTKGIFKGSKKLQFKLLTDVENPEYSQIFMVPKIGWNNYDKFLIGVKFHNQSLLKRQFRWNLTPKISTGTGKLAGSGLMQYTFLPTEGIFRSIAVAGAAKFEHYDKDLSYLKWSIFSVSNFEKDPRSTLAQGVILSYDYLDKQIPKSQLRTHEDKYGLFNLTYFYSRPDYIHESHGSVSFQASAPFQKIFGEFYYRWRFSPRQQLGIRLFAATFLENKLDTDYFNIGVSRTSDYAFNFNLLGRSETSGLLSQQYVLSEAGFKTDFGFTVNKWIISTNFEFPVWKMFDLYADAAVYKNSTHSEKFFYDSGVKIKVIPDFLEFYFPIQSTLGFEPKMDDYWKKIRFTFNFNLDSIVNHLRRGWY